MPLLALLLLPLPALALAPSADVWLGVEPARVPRFHPERQRALRAQAGWQAFLAAEGAGWRAVFDERTGQPRSAWGPPIDLGIGPRASAAELEAAVAELVARHGALFGLGAERLALRALHQEGGTALVELVQVVPPRTLGGGGEDPSAGGLAEGGAFELGAGLDPLSIGGGLVERAAFGFEPRLAGQGAELWRGRLLLSVVDGRLGWFSSGLHPEADQLGAVLVEAARAVEIVQEEGPVQAEQEVLGARLVVLPVERWGLGRQAPPSSSGTGLDYRTCWEVRTASASPVGRYVGLVDASTGELLNVHNEVRYIAGTLSGLHDERTVGDPLVSSPLVGLKLTGDGGETATTDPAGAFDLPGSAAASGRLSGTRLKVENKQGSNAGFTVDGAFELTSEAASQAEIDTWVFLHQVMAWRDLYAPTVDFGSVLTSNVNVNGTCNAYFDGAVNFFRDGGGCNNTGRIADVNHHEWGHGFHYYSLVTGDFDGSMSEGIADVVAFLQSGDAIIAPGFLLDGSGIRDVAPDRVYPDDLTGEVHSDGLIYAGAMWDLWALLEAAHGVDEGYDRTVSVLARGIRTGPSLESAYDAALLGDDDNGDLTDGTPNQCEILEAFTQHGLGPGGLSELLAFDHEPVTSAAAGATPAVEATLSNLAPRCISFTPSAARVWTRPASTGAWSSTPLAVDGERIDGALPAFAAGEVVEYYLETDSEEGEAVTWPPGGPIAPFSFAVGSLRALRCEDFEEDDGGFTHVLLEGRDELGANDWMHGTPRGLGGDPDFAWSGARVWGNDLGGGNYNGEYQNGKHNRLSSPEIDVSGYQSVIVQYRRWLGVEDGYYDQARIVRLGGDEGSTEDDIVLWTNHASEGGSADDHGEHHQDREWVAHSLRVDGIEDGRLRLGFELKSDGGLTFGGWTIDDLCVYAVEDDPSAVDPGGDGGAPAEPEPAPEAGGGCSCQAAPAGLGGAWLLALGAAWARRRRR